MDPFRISAAAQLQRSAVAHHRVAVLEHALEACVQQIRGILQREPPDTAPRPAFGVPQADVEGLGVADDDPGYLGYELCVVGARGAAQPLDVAEEAGKEPRVIGLRPRLQRRSASLPDRFDPVVRAKEEVRDFLAALVLGKPLDGGFADIAVVVSAQEADNVKKLAALMYDALT